MHQVHLKPWQHLLELLFALKSPYITRTQIHICVQKLLTLFKEALAYVSMTVLQHPRQTPLRKKKEK